MSTDYAHLNEAVNSTKQLQKMLQNFNKVFDALGEFQNLQQAVSVAEAAAATATSAARAKVAKEDNLARQRVEKFRATVAEAELARDEAEANLSDAQANLAEFEGACEKRMAEVNDATVAAEKKLAAVKADLAAIAAKVA